MPVYGLRPALSLVEGESATPFDAETVADGIKSQAYAPNQNVMDVGWQVIWSGASAPVSPNVEIQAAMRDVDAEYVTVDSSTIATTELGLLSNFMYKFLRVKKTGGGVTNCALTVIFNPKRRG
jgi:hypothetical protein